MKSVHMESNVATSNFDSALWDFDAAFFSLLLVEVEDQVKIISRFCWGLCHNSLVIFFFFGFSWGIFVQLVSINLYYSTIFLVLNELDPSIKQNLPTDSQHGKILLAWNIPLFLLWNGSYLVKACWHVVSDWRVNLRCETDRGKLVRFSGSNPLAALAMIDEGELDRKIVAILLNDPKASLVNDVDDVEKHVHTKNAKEKFQNGFYFLLLDMENYYYSGWPLCTNWPQCNSAPNSDHSPFSVPTQTLPNASETLQLGEFPSWPLPTEGAAEHRASSASKSHSQAEKRRRDRINAQLAALRKLIPKSDKMDKAALLGSVVERVKDLRRKAMDMSKVITVPTEIDEVTIDYYPAIQDDEIYTKVNIFKNNIIIKASVCCDDRPELFSELIQVLKGLRLTTIKADIASVGGRIKSILVLCSKDSEEGTVCLTTLKQSLKSAVNKIASLSTTSNFPTRSKRQRFFS
ncbi:hypothetical protein RIF29_17549 [Crotalaria pallida]|uniref:inorganic diphosphatase n=1 Tax=Crotalaria pallida TaxID=3830 RepID=A0AAN9FIB2_CROPI